MKQSKDTDNKAIDAQYIAVDQLKKFAIASNHEVDLNKTMLQIERANLSSVTSNILGSRRSSKKAETIIHHMNYLESTMPILTNILVAGISLRGNLKNRANEQISILSRDFKRCSKELAEIAASDKKFVKTPTIAKLKTLLNHNKEISSDVTYVLSETGAIQPCEKHTFDRIEVADYSYNNVSFFTFKENSNLCIAAAVNSSFIPKVFESIKIGELNNWLTSHNFKNK